MSVRDIYPKKPSIYLNAADMVGRRVKVKISGTELKEFNNNNEVEMKLVLSFEGKDKKMTLNKTNAMILSDRFGDDEADWIGKEIEIYTEKTKNRSGQLVDGLKVLPVIPVTTDFDDTIPF